MPNKGKSKAVVAQGPVSTYWCGTLNNFTEQEKENIRQWMQSDDVNYGVLAQEVGENGTPHLQMFVETKKRERLTAIVRKTKTNRGHWEVARAKDKQRSANYCKKGEQPSNEWKNMKDNGPNFGKNAKYEEFGSLSTTTQGDRTDIEALREFVLSALSLTEVIASEEHCNTVAKYLNYVKELWRSRPATPLQDVKLNSWQFGLWTALTDSNVTVRVQSRRIFWYWEPRGDTGKSFFTKYMVLNHGAEIVPNKTAEAAYMFEGQWLLLIDIPRTAEEHINFDLIERLKNGFIVSTKYMPCRKSFKHPEIVIFSNFDPAPHLGKMSMDRWIVHRLTEQEVADCEKLDYAVVLPDQHVEPVVPEPGPATIPTSTAPVIIVASDSEEEPLPNRKRQVVYESLSETEVKQEQDKEEIFVFESDDDLFNFL